MIVEVFVAERDAERRSEMSVATECSTSLWSLASPKHPASRQTRCQTSVRGAQQKAACVRHQRAAMELQPQQAFRPVQTRSALRYTPSRIGPPFRIGASRYQQKNFCLIRKPDALPV